MANNLLGYATAFEKAYGRRGKETENAWNVAHSIGLERQEELEEEKKRASLGGLARLFGGVGGGLLASLISVANPVIGAALIGAGAGFGGTAARAVSGAQNQVGVGRWDVAQGKQREEDYRSGLVSGGVSDAITGGLMAYSMPDILKFIKGAPKAEVPTEATPRLEDLMFQNDTVSWFE